MGGPCAVNTSALTCIDNIQKRVPKELAPIDHNISNVMKLLMFHRGSLESFLKKLEEHGLILVEDQAMKNLSLGNLLMQKKTKEIMAKHGDFMNQGMQKVADP
jgi:predicted transcriptional regulator